MHYSKLDLVFACQTSSSSDLVHVSRYFGLLQTYLSEEQASSVCNDGKGLGVFSTTASSSNG